MNSLLVKYPRVLKWFYPKRLSRLKSPKTLYLTFDDGPIPDVTPWVLAELKKHNAKATFFCIGENIQKHPEIFRQIIAAGHQIGNHTYNHLNGWKTSKETYLGNTMLTQKIIAEEKQETRGKKKETRNKRPETRHLKPETSNLKPLFRPPFGKIKNSQASALVNKGYKIVMWDVISWDFSEKVGERECFENVINHSREGSIVVFHDSLKAENNLKYTLPKVLTNFKKKGFEFKAL